MANIVLVTPRESDASVLSGGAWVDSLPLANLQDPQPTYPARSLDASASSTWFALDAGRPVAWDTLAFVGTDLPPGTLIRRRAAVAQLALTAAPGMDSGWVSPWPATGRPADWWLENWTAFQMFTPGGAWRWWRFDVDLTGTDATLALDFLQDLYQVVDGQGHVTIGRLVLGTRWTPARNFSYGIDKASVAADLRIVTPSGHTLGDTGRRARQWNIPFNFASQADAEQSVEDLVRYCGQARDVFVCLDPDAAETLHRQMMLGTFETVTRVVRVKPKVWQFTLSLRERI